MALRRTAVAEAVGDRTRAELGVLECEAEVLTRVDEGVLVRVAEADGARECERDTDTLRETLLVELSDRDDDKCRVDEGDLVRVAEADWARECERDAVGDERRRALGEGVRELDTHSAAIKASATTSAVNAAARGMACK